MNSLINQYQQEPILGEERMLFVRTNSILESMIKAPLILAGLLIVSLGVPLQYTFAFTRNIEITIYTDGSSHVSSLIEVDPLEPDYKLDLFGPTIDNFVAIGDNGFLLSSEISGRSVSLNTLGTSTATIEYDIHDLVSKEGRIWTFMLDTPSEFTLLMPKNAVIVGMSNLPLSMEIIDEQTKLHFSAGLSEINYVFGITTPVTPPPTENPRPSIQTDNSVFIGAIIAAGIGIGTIVLIRKKNTTKSVALRTPLEKSENVSSLESMLNEKEMRDDDKELIKFISQSGGEVLESDLRKKFLQPRTTMWRAVKRLERLGLVEIEKKDMQNLVKLRTEVEEE